MTPSSRSASRGSMISSRQCGKPSMMVPLLMIGSCLGVCHGFQAAGAWSPAISASRASMGKGPSSSNGGGVYMTTEGPSMSSRRSQPLMATRKHHLDIKSSGNVRCSGFICSKSKLFPQRTMSSSMTMATEDESSNDVSDENSNGSPLVKVWLSLRKLLAKLWALLLWPFRQLKSLVTKSDKDKTDNEPTSEAVAITEVENIAALEEETTAEEVTETNVSEVEAVAEETVEAKVDEFGEQEVITIIPHIIDVDKESADSTVEATTADESPDETTTTDTISNLPRQATPSNNVDLSGNWTLIVDETFTSQYDEYLRKLGQPMLVRTVALTVIGSTKEEAIQTDEGRKLFIRGVNVRGSWERTLEASEQMVQDGELGEDGQKKHAVEGHELQPMTTADGEDVEVASWWEQNENSFNKRKIEGAVHHSWVVGGKKYGGGDFENKRYLTDSGNILVCESTFHPVEEGREDAMVTWRFLREGAIYGDKALQMPNILDAFKKDKKSDAKEEVLPEPAVVVGDIMDEVAADTEAALAETGIVYESKDIANIDMLEEAIEQSSWVPPAGDRWAIAATDTDLSGKWKLIITEKFKKEYDDFLCSLGQPILVRGAAVVLIGNTREETEQADNGRSLYIKGINAKGIWERTLTSSGSDFDSTMKPGTDGKYTTHLRVPIVTADSENVEAESWWEDDGTTHVSWTYGVKRYGGGAFESKRYLENDGDVYVCESTFYPNDKGREKSYLKWKFLREGAAFMLDKDQ